MQLETPKYRDGDRVFDRSGNRGLVLRCFSKTKRTYYLKVRIDQGPRKGQWEWPERFTVDLHYAGGTHPDTCAACSREFLRRIPDQAAEVLCKQCAGEDWNRDEAAAARLAAVRQEMDREIAHERGGSA